MAKKAGTKRTKKDASSSTGNDVFVKLKEKFGNAKARPYRMAETFPVDCAIEHPKFGLGFVYTSAGQKIEVAFVDANRALVQNRK